MARLARWVGVNGYSIDLCVSPQNEIPLKVMLRRTYLKSLFILYSNIYYVNYATSSLLGHEMKKLALVSLECQTDVCYTKAVIKTQTSAIT